MTFLIRGSEWCDTLNLLPQFYLWSLQNVDGPSWPISETIPWERAKIQNIYVLQLFSFEIRAWISLSLLLCHLNDKFTSSRLNSIILERRRYGYFFGFTQESKIMITLARVLSLDVSKLALTEYMKIHESVFSVSFISCTHFQQQNFSTIANSFWLKKFFLTRREISPCRPRDLIKIGARQLTFSETLSAL